MILKLLAPVIGAAAVLGGTAALANAVTPPTTITAVTHISNHPDGGHGTPATWAFDTFDRTVTVTVAAVQNPVDTGKGLVDYTATISDSGYARTVLGAGSPNGTPGVQISHSVKADMEGTYSLTATAPTADTLTGTVPANVDDNFGSPAVSTTNWLTQAFATPSAVVVSGGAYNWTYTTRCEQWTDSSANGDGLGAADGNITGSLCRPVPPPIPVVSHERAYDIGHGREYTSWQQSVPSWDQVTVYGHHYYQVRYVHPGENDAVFSHLQDWRHYTEVIQPLHNDGSPWGPGGSFSFVS